MSTTIVHGRHTGATTDTEGTARSSHRVYGWMLAIATSILLWSVIGGVAWGIASFFN